MLRKFLPFVLVCLMLVSLVACGNDSVDKPGDESLAPSQGVVSNTQSPETDDGQDITNLAHADVDMVGDFPRYTIRLDSISSEANVFLFETDLVSVVFNGFADSIPPESYAKDQTPIPKEPGWCLKLTATAKKPDLSFSLDTIYNGSRMVLDGIGLNGWSMRLIGDNANATAAGIPPAADNTMSLYCYYLNTSIYGRPIYYLYEPLSKTFETNMSLRMVDNDEYIYEQFYLRVLIGDSTGESYSYTQEPEDVVLYSDDSHNLLMLGHQLWKDSSYDDENCYIIRFWNDGVFFKISDVYIDGVSCNKSVTYSSLGFFDLVISHDNLHSSLFGDSPISENSEIRLSYYIRETDDAPLQSFEYTFNVNPVPLELVDGESVSGVNGPSGYYMLAKPAN